MARDFDLSQEVQQDVNRFNRLNGKGIGDISPGGVIEYTLWSISILGILGMVATLPWVGPNNAIPGTVWLGYSLAFILLFGLLAGLIRWVRATGDDLDEGMNRRFDATRGR